MRLRFERAATFLLVVLILLDAFDDFVFTTDSFRDAVILFVVMYGVDLVGYAIAGLRRLGLVGHDDEDDPYDF